MSSSLNKLGQEFTLRNIEQSQVALKNMHRKNIFVNLKKHNKPVILRNVGTLKTKSNDVCKKKKSEIQTFPSPNFVQSTFSPWFTVVFVWK